MSRFKRSKNKSNKKSSISINEKISLLNKELKKTGMVSEVLDTSNVYSTSTHVPPLERIEGDVPNSSGIGAEGFSQNSSGSGNEGEPPSFSNLSDLFNSSVNSTIFKSTSFGGNQGYGIVIGPSFGAGTTYGIIEGGNIYRAVLGGFLAGGTRAPGHYEGIYNSYLEANKNSPGFYSDEQIANALEDWKLAEQVHAALVEIGFDNSKFNIPWKAWRLPKLFEDNEGVPSFAHPTKGTLFLHGFSLLGSVNRYLVQNSQPRTTTNPQRRGLEDEPIYPGPIESLFNLGKRGFEWLKEKAEAAKKELDAREDAIKGVLDAIPPFLNFLAHQINENSPWTKENPYPVKLDEKQTENMKEDIEEIFNEWGDDRVDEINNGSPMTNEEVNQVNNKINAQKNDDGRGDALDAKYPSSRLTLNNIGNSKAFEGNIKTNKDGSKTPTAIKDNYVFEGDADASAPGAPAIIKTMIDNEKVQNAIKKSNLKYPYRKDNEIDYDAIVGGADTPSILNKNMPIEVDLTTRSSFKESYITEGVGLGLYEPVAMNVDLADIRKGVMPEYPKKPPAKMIDGYHEKSPLRPKPLENEPYVKITKADLIRNHRLKPKEADEMMDTINMVNAHIKAHPEDLIHTQMRYPKDDPRLAELNWKMDQMLEAGEEYLDSNFKENQTLYKRAMDRTKKNIKLTNPEYVQQHYDELRGTIKSKPRINRKSPSRFFKKPVRKKSSMDEINDKIKQLDKDLLI